jgi:hypothetical protein
MEVEGNSPAEQAGLRSFTDYVRAHHMFSKNSVPTKKKVTKFYFLMPCPFTGPQFLTHLQNLTAFSAPAKTFVPTQKPILLNANHLIVWHKMFVIASICK